MIRRFYIYLKHRKGEHVIATDCWCKPTVESHRK